MFPSKFTENYIKNHVVLINLQLLIKELLNVL